MRLCEMLYLGSVGERCTRLSSNRYSRKGCGNATLHPYTQYHLRGDILPESEAHNATELETS